jgi:hypothetical protein
VTPLLLGIPENNFQGCKIPSDLRAFTYTIPISGFPCFRIWSCCSSNIQHIAPSLHQIIIGLRKTNN